jgi:hypothetical protein
MNGTGSGTDNQGEIKVIIRTIATLAFLCVSSICVLAYLDKQVPPELNTLTGGLVAALTAMLVKTTPTSSKPQEVTNPPDKPIETKSVTQPFI